MSDYDFASAGKTLITAGVKTVLSGRKAAGPTAAAILAADNSDTAMLALFNGCRGEYLAARRDGAKTKATDLGKAWKLVKDSLAYHLDNAGYRATWPNWASGDGSCELLTKADAKDMAKAKAAARAEADAAALAQYETDRAAAETTALREKGPADLAADLANIIRTWSDNTAEHAAVLSILSESFAAASKPAASKPAASEPAAA